MRNLIVVLGDQLNRDSAAFDGFDANRDAVWMAEASEESTHIPSTKMRIAVFLSAMRHFREGCEADGLTVHYHELTPDDTMATTLSDLLTASLGHLSPERVRLVQPGDYRVHQALEGACKAADVPVDLCEDRHFLCTAERFRQWARGRKQLRMEYFYREMRRDHAVLVEPNGKDPVGGAWNFDADNRQAFGKGGPGLLPQPPSFEPDATTRRVIALVNERFHDHPGTVTEADFRWAMTPQQARQALEAFIRDRLPHFGQYQDAMWTGEPFLYHSLISSCLNLKLLDPREAIAAAETAYRDGHAPLAAVEGFIRQILGWREFVRGIYWHDMPAYLERNHLAADQPLPAFFWSGDTDMRCLREALSQTLRYGYAHHIQRLMVTGLYAMLLGVEPKAIHAWYLSVYVDAVEWVELPNVLGMSQYGDGGIMASKPYAATGKYINRMSNYCAHCPFDPDKAHGDGACPFTTLYWDFLRRNRDTLAAIPRMTLQLRNIDRKSGAEWNHITAAAQKLRH